MLRTHTCGELNKDHANTEVTLSGWVDSMRISGKIGFLILRDRYGKTQCFLGKDIIEKFGEIRRESVVQVSGMVKLRPENQQRPQEPTGEIELSTSNLKVISDCEPLPLEMDDDVVQTSEELRLKYRYLDLRRPSMVKNLTMRHKVVQSLRTNMDKHNFLEITTPILTKSSPEGARDYLVPARLHPGKFYALPQAPQQYKQLLMVGGIDKYFQIAPCFRDENARANRAPGEFYQFDVEMSFVHQEDILKLIESLMVDLVKELYPNKKITQVPFPRLNYDDVMKEYGVDSPDIRKNKEDPDELGFCFVINFPLFVKQSEEDFFHGAGKEWGPCHHMFTMPHEDDLEFLESDPGKVRSYQHDLVLNGMEVGGGSIRIHDAKIQQKIFDLIGFSKEQAGEFSHMLEAFTYGVPPHGGIALGVDRLLMLLMNEPSIREIIAFPKNKDARDVTLDAPSTVSLEQLDELNISSKK